MIGRTLGHFLILEKIGSGGMGEVYRAHDEHLERDVAVKVLPPGMLADDAARKRFRQEALALSKLNHPNIATVHDFVSEAQADFLVMECVPGTTLAEKLATGPLPEKDILALGIQLAEGLAAAHDQGVIHCDLKPGNLRITPERRLKVLDFGLARFLGAAGDSGPTQTEALVRDAAGTLPYMPPGQLNGAPPETRSDLYSAGAVLYEMATGQRLFPHEREPQRQLVAILHQAPRPPRALNPHISPGLESIILKCLEKDPDHRYQSAREMVADLRRLGAGTSLINVVAAVATRRSRRNLLIASLSAVCLVALALVGSWWWMRHRSAAIQTVHSLAVLPFTNFSNDPEQQYFVDGMTDSLITDLGQTGALRVISRTSVMQYRDPKKPAGEIARELQVDAVVEGSVWRSGEQVRVTARLIQAATDAQIWSRSYEKDVRDLLSLQRDLAGAIASEIKVTITPQEQPQLADGHTLNPEAYEAYLKGNYLVQGSPAQKRLAEQEFERAIRLDPKYAPAYAGLADFYWSNAQISPSEAMPKAREYVLTALRLDPSLGHAHRTLGIIRFYGDWDWAAAEAALKRAIELNPNDAESHRTYAYYLSARGDAEGALAQARQAEQLDPLSLISRITTGWVYYYAGQYQPAVEQCRKALELDANSAGAHDCLASSFTMLGMHQEAIAHGKQAAALWGNEPSRAAGLGRAYARAGDKAAARGVLREMLERSSRSYVPPYLIATVLVSLDEQQQALTWLERALSDRDRYLVLLNVDCAFKPLRKDQRFLDLARRVGFPPP